VNAVKPLRQLIALRRRQQERFEAEVREQTKRLREAEREADAARTHETACAHREQASVGKRHQLMECGFAPLDLIIAELEVKASAAATQVAAAARAKVETAAKTQFEALLACRARAARNLQRLGDLEERLVKVLRARAEHEEDVDAEESEETAAARIVARRSALAEAHGV
jgi:phage-related tail protein